MQNRQLNDFFKNLQRVLGAKDYSQIEDLILFKNLPIVTSHSQIYEVSLSKRMLEEHENFFKIVNLLIIIKSPLNSNVLENYQQVAKELSHSSFLCENYEFNTFLKQLFQQMKLELKTLKLLNENSLDVIISSLRQIFAEQKKNEFYKAVAVTLNSLFYFYFKINQFHQCTYLLKMIDPFVKVIFGSSDRIEALNLHYYIARLNQFGGQLGNVEEHLDKALQLAFSKNQLKQVLKILIPVKINFGKMPSLSMLRKFELKEYEDLTIAIKDGNLQLFNALIESNIQTWIRSGVYFMLHECKSILMRNLVKKVWIILDKPSSISLKKLQIAFNFNSTTPYSIDEIVSLLSGLISKDFIRGLVYPDDAVLHLKKVPFSDL
jgi:hypothetical protein